MCYNLKNTHGLEPLQEPTRNYLTTILRNIVTSKAAVGPVNTSNSKIVAVLTPQEELIAANTKIKWL